MKFLQYILLLIVVSRIESVDDQYFNKKIETTVHFDKFMVDCENHRNLPMQYTLNSMKDTKSGYLLIDYMITNAKDLSKMPLSIKFEVVRCSKREAPDTCVAFTSFSSDKVCQFYAGKNDPWTPMFACLQPPIQCPLIKAVHKGRNCTMDLAAFKWFPLGKDYWKFIFSISNKRTKELLGCNFFAGYLRKNV